MIAIEELLDDLALPRHVTFALANVPLYHLQLGFGRAHKRSIRPFRPHRQGRNAALLRGRQHKAGSRVELR